MGMESPPFKAPGYRILDQLYESPSTAVFRAIRLKDRLPVVLKMLKPSSVSPLALSRYRQEYETARTLHSANVIKVYGLESLSRALFLVLEDIEGVPLSGLLRQRTRVGIETFPFAAFFTIAVKIVDGLSAIHAAGIIHKEICPSNVVFNPATDALRIIDFDSSTTLGRENPGMDDSGIRERSLPYLSPEQTGRMNRTVDYRADFYALGVTFYELLTGRLPFESTDPLELVHCHLAKTPVEPHLLNPDIPVTVSRIVLKLMAKAPEDRYQSARGLAWDIGACAEQWRAGGEVSSFELGLQDRLDRFLIPERLYGRETETASLLAAFERVARGGSEMVLVTGDPGIGKTAVVNEVHKPIARQHGYFIRGKFDQFNRGIPFSGFVQALRDLMGQLLRESGPRLRGIEEGILSALGENGRVIIDVVPELERIIGPQPPAPELSGAAAEIRFNLLFEKFIAACATADHPLVVFLDDMQWADLASLKLMRLLIAEARAGHLLLIGAYRGNEVTPVHPLAVTLEEIRETGARLTAIALPPLDESDISLLIADTLSCSAKLAAPLTALVYGKTRGNPFFNNQFLKALHDEGLIAFNGEAGYWECDIERVSAVTLTQDVVEFMAVRLQKLPQETQAALELAACIGNSFDLGTLAVVCRKTQVETATDLWPALQAGLVLPQSRVYRLFPGGDAETDNPFSDLAQTPTYRFSHDHAQQAAYSLIPEEDKKSTHLHIGQLLLANTPAQERAEKVFAIAGQLNRGADLLSGAAERHGLSELNLEAGRKAKSATAYSAAREYFSVGRGLLLPESWRNDYDFTLALYNASAEAAYLDGDFDEMDRMVDAVLANARTLLDKVDVFLVRIVSLATRNLLLDSIKCGLDVLKSMGVKFPAKPSAADISAAAEEIRSVYEEKGIANLIDLPPMTDPLHLAAMRILISISASAFLSIPPLYPLLIAKQVRLSVDHGNTPAATFSYASYGVVLCGGMGDVETGYEFGQLAIELQRRTNAKEWECKTFGIVNTFIAHWKTHVRETLAPLLAGYYTGLETGDLQFAGYAVVIYSAYMYFPGIEKSLPELQKESIDLSESMRRLKQITIYQYYQMLLQAMHDLQEGRSSPQYLSGEYYDEQAMRPRHEQANDRNGLFYLTFHKLILSYIFGEYGQAMKDTADVERHLDGGSGFPYIPIYCLFDSLTRLAFHRENPQDYPKEELVRRIEANQDKLKNWSRHAPMNFRHKIDLVEAERLRTFKKRLQAMEAYDRAIEGARKNGYLREEALANELAASFYLEWGRQRIGEAYMREARLRYAAWGANAKVAELERRYPWLREPGAERAARTGDERAGVEPQGGSRFDRNAGSPRLRAGPELDLATVVKAMQAIAAEIELPRLLTQLLRIAIQNAGAQRGALILQRAGQWMIEALGDVESLEISVTALDPRESGAAPADIVMAVARTGKSVILDDAAGSGDFVNDPYIVRRGIRSVICTPLINQGRLSGILYLENNLARNAFSAKRLELLNLLSAQMALSLDNARSFQRAQAEIAERKLAESALRESEERFRTIFDSVNDAIFVHDAKSGAILDVNATMCRMYGCTREEAIELSVDKFSSGEPPYSRQDAFAWMKKAVEGATPLFEWRAKARDGRLFWVEISMRLAVINGANRLLVTARDISYRKRVEEALKEKTDELDRYFTGSLDLLCIANTAGYFIRLNPEWEKVLGYPLSELHGRQFMDFVHPEDRQPTMEAIASLAAQHSVTRFINRYKCKDGTYRWLEWNSYPSGDIINAIARDITERKQAEKKIRLLNERLEQRVNERTAELETANKELESFSYSVSHDLRAPLRAIAGHANILAEDYGSALDAEGKRICNVIRENTRRMGQLIDDLLSFSRLGRSEVRSVEIDMKKLALAVFEELTTPEARERVDFRLSDLPAAIGDPTMIRQVWVNLLSNALKFSSKLERARIEVAGEAGETESVYSVRDNGAGFDMRYAGKLFNVFQRLHSGREFEGTGVGLAIVNRIIWRHGGKVWAEGEPDKGAAFYFTFPQRRKTS